MRCPYNFLFIPSCTDCRLLASPHSREATVLTLHQRNFAKSTSSQEEKGFPDLLQERLQTQRAHCVHSQNSDAQEALRGHRALWSESQLVSTWAFGSLCFSCFAFCVSCGWLWFSFERIWASESSNQMDRQSQSVHFPSKAWSVRLTFWAFDDESISKAKSRNSARNYIEYQHSKCSSTVHAWALQPL